MEVNIQLAFRKRDCSR